MIRITRRRAMAGTALALLLAGAGTYAFWDDPTLDGSKEINAALPTEKDMPGFMPNRGIEGVLSPPGGDRNGKAVLTGRELGAQCRTYRKQEDGWACQGLQGMGMVGFANTSNVDSRVGSFVLAYKDDDAAETAWKKMVEKTRKELPKAKEQKAPHVGDESQYFVLGTGSVVVLRSGSVVAQAMSFYEYGYKDGAEYADELKDPIRMWSALQVKKMEEALK